MFKNRLTPLNLIIHQGCQMIVVNYKFGTKRGRNRNLLELYSIPSSLVFFFYYFHFGKADLTRNLLLV